MSAINIYCDESCHLPNDRQPIMVLGAIDCPKDHARDVAVSLREARVRHGLSPYLEIKWGGISPSKLDFFLDVLDVFWEDPLLRFRTVVASKKNLDHEGFGQDHDDWYHKMYYQLLRYLVTSNSEDHFRVYLDIKDTKSAAKLRRLHDVICNGIRDFSHEILRDVQALRSHEVPLIQLTDLFTGATAYASRPREPRDSAAKLQFVRALEKRSGRSLTTSSWLSERKFNVFHWEPQS
jgi:hypothetical protein